MIKNKLVLLVVIVLLLGASFYNYNTRIEVNSDFILSSQVNPKSQLPKDFHLQVTIIKGLRDNALAFGYLEGGGQKVNFYKGFILNSRNRVEQQVCRLQCQTQESAGVFTERYLYLRIKAGKVERLDLIQSKTDLKTSKTESEVGTYLLFK